jgi:O-antigen/teichoic acid export membrane protein
MNERSRDTTGPRRSLRTNALANGLGFLVQMAVALVLSPILLHGLGAQRYGVWSLVESVLAYLMLFDLGVAASVVRYVARFESTRDQDSLQRVFNTSLAVFAAAGGAVLLVVLALVVGGMPWIRMPADLVEEGRWMLLLLGVNLAISLPLGVFSAVLDGLERYPTKTAIRTAGLALRSVIFLAIVHAKGGLLDLAWAITGCNLLEHAALAAAAWWYLPGLRLSPRWIDRDTFRLIRGYSLHAFLALVAGRISFQTDALVIGAFLAPQYIAFFALGARLVEYAKNALRALTTVLTPAVSSLDARGDDEGIRRVLLHGTRSVLWLILPIQIGLFLLGRPFLHLWLGPEYAEASYPTLAILALPLSLAMCQSVCARILYGLGELRWFVCVVVIEALVNLGLSIALVQPLGIEGVAWGTTIPNMAANLVVIVYVCRRVGVGAGEYMGRAWLAPALAAAVLAGGWWAMKTPVRWPELLLVGGVGLAGQAALALFVEWGPPAVLGRLRSLLAPPKVTSGSG